MVDDFIFELFYLKILNLADLFKSNLSSTNLDTEFTNITVNPMLKNNLSLNSYRNLKYSVDI